MNIQQFYNNVCSSLRDHGNVFGGVHERGWYWVDPNCPKNRCAIARFVKGDTDSQVMNNLKKLLNINSNIKLVQNPVIKEVVTLFDYYPCEVNNKDRLEIQLKAIADLNKLNYSEQVTSQESNKILILED